MVENLEKLETCKRYDDAVGDKFHISVGVVETPVSESGGETNEGAAGGDTTVVNCLAPEKELIPPLFLADTLQ